MTRKPWFWCPVCACRLHVYSSRWRLVYVRTDPGVWTAAELALIKARAAAKAALLAVLCE